MTAKSFEGDHSTNPQLQISIEPQPEQSRAEPELNSEVVEQSGSYESMVPATARPAVEAYLEQQDSDFDLVDAQGQTTNGLGTRARAGIETSEDVDRKAGEIGRKIVASQKSTSRPKSRPYYGRKGGSPPAHVLDDVRRAQGIKD